MKILQKSLVLDKRQYYEVHLHIINPLLPNRLTDKEISVLACFLSLDESLVEDDRFNTVARKRVRDELNLSPGGLSNYLKSMIDKGHLTKSELSRKIAVRDYIIPQADKQFYQFKIICRDNG